MRVLLVVACLAVTCFAAKCRDEDKLCAGARDGTFLFDVQEETIKIYKKFLQEKKVKMFNGTQIGFLMEQGINFMCHLETTPDKSTCKNEFEKLPAQCINELCNLFSGAEGFIDETIKALISVDSDDKFFNTIEKKIIVPMMNYSCKCLVKMFGAWMACKHTIGESNIWLAIDNFIVEPNTDYIGNKTWQRYWVDVVRDEIPWGDIRTLFNRTMVNLCQWNSDKRGRDNLCYTYFFDAFTKLYEVYLEVTGKKAAGLNRKDSLIDCTTYDVYSEEVVENMSFSDIKEAVVAKFCVKNCTTPYQKHLLGCCSATMIQDTALNEAVINTFEGLPKILFKVLRENSEGNSSFDIPLYLENYKDVLDILRNPTCKNCVSYDVTPCNPCKGLKGDEKNDCMDQQNGDRTEGSQPEEEENPCEGLEGKQLKICKRCKAKPARRRGGSL